MQNYKILPLLLITLLLFSACKKENESSTTTNSNSTNSQSIIRIEVQGLDGVNKSGINVVMSDSLISYTRPFTVIKSAISDANGIALFDMKEYEPFMPKTFYFGALRQEGNATILMGTREIVNVLKGIEYKSNLVLLY